MNTDNGGGGGGGGREKEASFASVRVFIIYLLLLSPCIIECATQEENINAQSRTTNERERGKKGWVGRSALFCPCHFIPLLSLFFTLIKKPLFFR